MKRRGPREHVFYRHSEDVWYYILSPEVLTFPNPEDACPYGLLAIGGDLSPERLVRAYSKGIFPWYSDNQPILWHSLNPRFILRFADFHTPKSLRKTLRKRPFRVTVDQAFRDVIQSCRVTHGVDKAWIMPEMVEAYTELHNLGLAHSVECWTGNALVGGIYGVSLGRAFYAESMFHTVSEASKVALYALVELLKSMGFTWMDCQQKTANISRFGGVEVPRAEFQAMLKSALGHDTIKGRWSLPPELSARLNGSEPPR